MNKKNTSNRVLNEILASNCTNKDSRFAPLIADDRAGPIKSRFNRLGPGSGTSGLHGSVNPLIGLGFAGWFLFQSFAVVAQDLDTPASNNAEENAEAAALVATELEQDQLAINQQLADMDQRVNQLAASQADIESRIEQLAQSFQQQLQQQQGVQREAERDFALELSLIESSALLSMAKARLELGGAKSAVLNLYEQVNQQLTAINDSRLSRPRELIADEIRMIRDLESPDWTTMGANLAGWERQVDTWPMLTENADPNVESNQSAAADAGDTAATDDEQPGWLGGMRESLGKLVTVERRDGTSLDTEMVVAIKEQLRLNLAAAGLAAERRDLSALKMRVGQISALIDEYFQVDSEPLVSVRAELNSIDDLSVAPAPTELGQTAGALSRLIDSL